MSKDADRFPTDLEGLPEAVPSEVVEIADGERFELRIAPISKLVGDLDGALPYRRAP